jgi:acid phosphatase (class A)
MDAMGAGWFDAAGAGWSDSGGGSPHGQVFAMRADRPLAANPVPLNANPTFPPRYWDGDLFALTFLPDFFTANVPALGGKWDAAITVGAPSPPVQSGPAAPGTDIIDVLLELAVTERPEAMGEILNQANNQQLCFLQLLMITHNSHPRTYFAMKLAARVGEVVMMHLKRKWNRPRPTQYCPTLYPPIPVPGHASYPAGHAVIAHLTALVLAEVTKGTAATSPYVDALTLLAQEIARNRVIAGLHFFSDIAAGADAAKKTFDFLTGMPIPTTAPTPPNFTYNSVIKAAQSEWP